MSNWITDNPNAPGPYTDANAASTPKDYSELDASDINALWQALSDTRAYILSLSPGDGTLRPPTTNPATDLYISSGSAPDGHGSIHGGDLYLEAGSGAGGGAHGNVKMFNLPVHDNNGDALSAGMPVGALYRTLTGQILIVVP